MDGTKFDKLARVFADGSDRRGFLKRIAGVAAGAAILSTPGRVLAGIKDDYACKYDDDCGKKEHCYFAEDAYEGYCECNEGYERGEDGKCYRIDGCQTDDDCDATKHEFCYLAEYDEYGYGTCECADGYYFDEKLGYCYATTPVCKTDDDCNKSWYEDYYDEYGYYPEYKDGYYYDDKGDTLPTFWCNYGYCEEVVVVPPPPPPPPPKPEKPDNCMKTCVARKRSRAKGGRRSKGRNVRKSCQTWCAKRNKRR